MSTNTKTLENQKAKLIPLSSSVRKGLSVKLEELKITLLSKNEDRRLNSFERAFKCRGGLPKVSFIQFIERFTLLGGIRNEVFVTAYILLKRILKKVEFQEASCLFKLLAITLFLSHKLIIDYEVWHMDEWGKLAGIDQADVEKLEVKLVSQVLNFDLNVTAEEFKRGEECLIAYSLIQ